MNLVNSGSLDIGYSGSPSDSGALAIITLSGSSVSLGQLYTGGTGAVTFDSGAMAEAFSGMTTGT